MHGRPVDKATQLELELHPTLRFACPWCKQPCCVATARNGRQGIAHPFPACVTFDHTPAASILAIVHQQPAEAS